MDIKKLEDHFNAQQIFFNHLVMSLASYSPQVVWDTLAGVRHTLDTEPEIPDGQRAVMERMCQSFTEFMTDHSGKP